MERPVEILLVCIAFCYVTEIMEYAGDAIRGHRHDSADRRPATSPGDANTPRT
jgi:hypothetical protein